MNTSRACVVAFVLAVAPAAVADTPDWVNYQGVLRDAAGVPRSGSFDMTFRFFDEEVGGNEILVDAHVASGTGAVGVLDGLFDVYLGSGAVSDGAAPLPGDPFTSLVDVFSAFQEVWLEITIGGEVLSPRVPINAVPYAHHAQTAAHAFEAETLGGLPVGSFLDTSASYQTKSGSLQVNGSLVAAGNVIGFGFDAQTSIRVTATNMSVVGGDQPTDDLFLGAGLSTDGRSGSVQILGEAEMQLQAGDGRFLFSNGATGTFTANLDPTGTFTAVNNLVAQGNALRFGAPGAIISANTGGMTLLAGDADSDDLFLYAGNDFTDGGIEIAGDAQVNLRSGNGAFSFFNGATGSIVASLDPTGDVVAVDDLVASGNELRFGAAGARLAATDIQLDLIAGDADGDDLFLRAGNDSTDGSIDIFGDNLMTLRSGNGSFVFVNGASGATLASLNSGGSFVAQGDLETIGSDLRFGATSSARISRDPTFDDLVFARDEDANSNAWFLVYTNGGTIEQMRIEDQDEAAALFDGAVTANGLDYAEAFSIEDPTLAPGEVVVFDPARPGFVARSTEAYSPLVAGVISEKPGFLTGGSFDAEEAADPELALRKREAAAAGDYAAAREMAIVLTQKKRDTQRPVALAGRVPVKVDATHGAVRPGDHLTSSPTPGHAMVMKESGPSIGIALEGFEGPGSGVILAFVQRGGFVPAEQARLAQDVVARTPDPTSGVQVLPSDLQLVLDGSGGGEARFSIFRDGDVASPRAEVFRVDERGNVWAKGAFRPRSMDLAETFAVSEAVEAGDVLVVDPERPGRYMRGRRAEDRSVVGVVAADPGVLLGGDVSRVLDESPELAEALARARVEGDRDAEAKAWADLERRFVAAYAPVALSGTVTVKVDASRGAIEPGDLLVASPNPGHAMRASEPVAAGAVIGKALERHAGGVGVIRMIVMLR